VVTVSEAPAQPAGSSGVGVGFAVTSVAAVQFGATLAAHLFSRVGPVGTVSLRLIGAALVLLALYRPWRRSWTRSDLLVSAAFGLVFAAMNTTLYLGLDRLPIATVITLEFLGPLTVAIATAGSWSTRVWAVPAGGGVALLGGELSGHDVLGVVFALCAATCWACYILLSGRIGRTGTGLAGLTVGTVVAAVAVTPFGAAVAGGALLRPSTAALGLAVGVLSSAIPYSLDLLALRRLPTAVFGVLTSLNPGVAAVAGWLVLDEAIGVRSGVGIALVSLASVGVTVTPLVRRSLGRRGPAAEPVTVLDEPVTAA
jgi:inner membrane transporter RhtA